MRLRWLNRRFNVLVVQPFHSIGREDIWWVKEVKNLVRHLKSKQLKRLKVYLFWSWAVLASKLSYPLKWYFYSFPVREVYSAWRMGMLISALATHQAVPVPDAYNSGLGTGACFPLPSFHWGWRWVCTVSVDCAWDNEAEDGLKVPKETAATEVVYNGDFQMALDMIQGSGFQNCRLAFPIITYTYDALDSSCCCQKCQHLLSSLNIELFWMAVDMLGLSPNSLCLSALLTAVTLWCVSRVLGTLIQNPGYSLHFKVIPVCEKKSTVTFLFLLPAF